VDSIPPRATLESPEISSDRFYFRSVFQTSLIFVEFADAASIQPEGLPWFKASVLSPSVCRFIRSSSRMSFDYAQNRGL